MGSSQAITKSELEALYATKSVGQIAGDLGVARSTIYYYLRKYKIPRRSKSEAQALHLANNEHQRVGHKHSDKTRERISSSRRAFWDSEDGQRQREDLRQLRLSEWDELSAKDRTKVVHRLRDAARPNPGELSRFGTLLAEFLANREKIQTGIRLTRNHISDIILPDRRVVIELLLPVAVYGPQEQARVETRYDKLTANLQSAGFRVVIIQDKSNSISRARCVRIYEQLLDFFDDKALRSLTITS